MKIIYIFLFTIIFITPIFSQVNLKSGLVACYPFNGNAKDESGNGNNGTVNGANLTTDRFGKVDNAYNFNGSSSYIDIPSNKLQNPTFSYSAWIKPNSLPQSGIAFFIFSVGSGSGDQGIGLNNGYTNGTDGFTGGGYLDVGENAFCQQGALPNVNQWYHVVVIRSTDKYSVYVDGVFICSTAILAKPPFYGTGTAQTTIGSRWNKGQFSDCVIDDLHLYNRPLNAAEVKALYDGNSPQTITISASNSAPCGGDKITFTANGATNTSKHQWKIDGVNQGTNSKTFDYNSPNKSADYSVKITVEITDEDPCFPQKSVVVDKNIAIKNCVIPPINTGNKILIPTAFTPNGDGTNDVWELTTLAGNGDLIVEIYNRWGEIVFYSKGYSEPWNGTYKGSPVPEGTYAYVVRVDDEKVFRGAVLVVR